MKNQGRNRFRTLVLLLVLSAMILILTGCAGAPGMTVNEVDRRHHNHIRSNWVMMQDDIDDFLMLDRPSRLNDLVIR